MRSLLLGLFIGISAAAVVSAQMTHQRETINVSTDLSLGMPEVDAINQLKKAGASLEKADVPKELQAKGVTSLWAVNGKKHRGGTLAFVAFSSGKLDFVTKFLDVPRGDNIAFGKQLYAAMQELESEGDSQCTIATKSRDESGFAEKIAKLRCGNKTVVVQVSRFERQDEAVQLREELGDTSY